MIIRAVAAALSTPAGEVLISEDASGLDIHRLLEGYADTRLKIFSQCDNLGLWPNHLFLIRQAKGEWIKFLQTDDLFTEASMRDFCEAADENTALVSMTPEYHHEDGTVVKKEAIDQIRTFKQGTYLERFSRYGNEPGRPSYCLYKKSAMQLSEEWWRKDVSADLMQNIWLSTQGDVILLPPNEMVCGVHSKQDGVNQSLRLVRDRLMNSMIILRKTDATRFRTPSVVLGIVDYIPVFVNFVKAGICGRGLADLRVFGKDFLYLLFTFFRYIRLWPSITRYARFKFKDYL